MSSLPIAYRAEGLPRGFSRNGPGDLLVNWDDVLWAAVTVGRPNRNYVFRHGHASIYEAIFRWSLVRMALEQTSPRGRLLRRAEAAKTLDPTEKGAINYFLGMIFCKLFAPKLLNTPWLLHLDVFCPQLNPVLRRRSRPDLVGQEIGTSRWHGFECKGRISSPDATVKQKAKNQAQQLVSVAGKRCELHVAAITYFKTDVLQFYWRDPAPREEEQIAVPFTPDAWRHYYAPIFDLLRSYPEDLEWMQQASYLVPTEQADAKVGVHPEVLRALVQSEWEEARKIAEKIDHQLGDLTYQDDGIAVVAGKT